jgi:cytoskeletal protein CcmA (bactofilin family)
LARTEQFNAGVPVEFAAEVSTVGKSLRVHGELAGSEPLFVDGKIEGAIYLPNDRVTIRVGGHVIANIVAREIVVLGKVQGNCQASDRVELRSSGSLTGDITAARVVIEDGAFFKGGLDIRRVLTQERQIAVEGTALADSYDARAEESIREGRYQTLTEESDIDQLLPRKRASHRVFAGSRTTAETH